MAVNEEIVTGKKFRRLIDVATNKWRRYSFWNKAKDTECEDGTDVETKVGAIKGITTSTNVSETGYAADAKTVSEINQSLGSEEISSVGTNVKNAINNLYYTSATILGGLNRILHGYDAATGRFLIQFVFSNNDIHAITFGMSDIQYSHWDGSKWTIIWTK